MFDENEKRHPSASTISPDKQNQESHGNDENNSFSDEFKAVVDNAAEGVVIIQDDLIRYFNQAALNISGYPPEIYVKTHISKILHPDDVAKMVDRYKRRLAGEDVPAFSEARFVRYDRSEGWMEVRSSQINWKGKPATVNFFSDITRRKTAEEALQVSEEKYRLFFHVSPDALVVTRDGLIIHVNDAALNLFGLKDASEIIGTDPIKWVDPKFRELAQDRLDRLYAKSEKLPRSEYRIVRKDGVLRDIDAQSSSMRDRNGTLSLAVRRDITELKRMAEHLRQYQKLESIGTLAGGIAHDFNNILGIILGNTELAMDDVPEWNPARQNLDEARKACLRAKDVVRQILSFSRKSEAEQKPVDIANVVTESLKLLRASIPTSIDIRQHISNDLADILGDPTQIHQIMINLCTNAAHAMENYGGTLEVAVENKEIDEDRVSLYPELNPGPHVHLRVSDTGDGIGPEIIDRVFDPYFTTKDVGKGTGLGLSVVHGIVNGHNGRIWVESEPEKGSTFRILFPAVEGKTREEPKELQELPAGKESILFVDDEEPMVKLNQQRLEKLGYRVTGKTDPSEALGFFRAGPDRIDLVITDMTMPKMTGDKLVQAILEIRSDMPIILCTGYSEKISKESAQKLGIRKYIEKPIEMVNLARSVREVLDSNIITKDKPCKIE